jgi:hypothetical protein
VISLVAWNREKGMALHVLSNMFDRDQRLISLKATCFNSVQTTHQAGWCSSYTLDSSTELLAVVTEEL